jgi:hypothetical protein
MNNTRVSVGGCDMSRALDTVSNFSLDFRDAYPCDRTRNHSDSN